MDKAQEPINSEVGICEHVKTNIMKYRITWVENMGCKFDLIYVYTSRERKEGGGYG